MRRPFSEITGNIMDFNFLVPFGEATSIVNATLVPFGGDSDDDSNDDDSNDASQQLDDSSDQSDKSDDSDNDDTDEFSGYTTKELRRIAKDLASSKKAAERERDSAKGELTAKQREKLDKEQRLEAELGDEKKDNATLRATNAKLAIINAIICESKYEWHNPEIVAQQLNPSIVKVNDDGTVEGLKKELERVSKDHAYLLKAKGAQQGKPTGFQPGKGASSAGADAPGVKELVKTYPALASRM